MSPRERRRLLRLLGGAAALAALLGLAAGSGRGDVWQAGLADFLYAPGTVEPSSRVTIVALDDRSSRAFIGDRPVTTRPREAFAALVDRLAAAGARVVAFDLLFEVENSQDDLLADAIRRAGNVLVGAVGANPQAPSQRPGVVAYPVLEESVPAIVAAAAGEAHANVSPDQDGVVRRLPLLIQYRDRQVPALALAAVARYLRRPAPLDEPLTSGYLPLAGRQVPVDSLYQALVNYAGGPDRRGKSAFAVVPMLDVVQGTADPELLRDRIVFVGPWSQQERDDRLTPLGTMYGVEIHANAAEMLLRGAFLVPAPITLTVASVLLLALLTALAVWRLRPALAGLAALALLAAYVVAAALAFQQGTVLNMLYPPLAAILGFVVLNAYQVVFEQAEQRALRRVLSRYLSPAVAAEVSREPDRVYLGGDLRTMTVLFSDIRGFTTLSERTPPRELVALLNEYLTAMVDVLFQHGGTLDKYMGDAIMAFWNAPQPQPDHAARACRTALAMGAALDRLRRDWTARGVPTLDIGIGLNTGPMIFGNMGSVLRTDFTVIGDSVNLGSRLEGLNKEYGTRIIVGESTRAAAGDAFLYRFLDLVAVKGKTEPVAIYELLAPAGALPSEREPVLAAYARGLAAYQARDWAAAHEAFAAALALDPSDGPSLLYRTRADEYLAAPPPASWDGVYVATHK
ncbi:MAG TPA: adenylate/guanylate cyclase domain-containing protein [Chloroflexota bacterium]|nr:adenylate/guanylate cyclase domain-containing protein [Chloroflexota bacterium]